MLCSKCSEIVKPVVALDIDGTCGDYHGHLIRFAEAYLGSAGPTAERRGYPTRITWELDGSIPMREWFCHYFNVSVDIWRDIKLAYRQGAQKRSMPVYPGAGNLSRVLQAAGAEVWITTTRPYQRLDNIDPDTQAWLQRNGIKFDYMLYDENKYGQLAQRVGVDRVVGILEDLPEQYDAAEAIFGEGVPLHRVNPYNAAAVRLPRAGGLSTERQPVVDLRQAERILVKRVTDWTAAHRMENE
jgi:hypothetical protein